MAKQQTIGVKLYTTVPNKTDKFTPMPLQVGYCHNVAAKTNHHENPLGATKTTTEPLPTAGSKVQPVCFCF